ncbi:MAG TPA: hypothetical protein VFS19_02970 [Planctomycetota bacterium]|nr:hypothetical protein [Planctomycetota bacterium]
MKRSCFRRGPFGLKVTPGDIESCFTFLRLAARLLRTVRANPAREPWAPWRLIGKPAPVFRRRP